MVASPNSPRSGEYVSDAQEYNQVLVDETTSIVDRVAEGYLLRRKLPNNPEEIEATVRRARFELELVEQMLATRREVVDDDE
jgi:hypothetical protein